MKIGILTLPLHTNYGGILQAYALQTVLERMGHEVEVLDQPNQIHRTWWRNGITFAKRIIMRAVGKHVRINYQKEYNEKEKAKRRNVKVFIQKNIKRREMKNYSHISSTDYDAIVVGSDQIWRRRYMPQNRVEIAFLDFTKGWGIKRVAYAASFGIDYWDYSDKDTKIAKQAISRFDAVSTRELNGVTLCQEHLGYTTAVQVLDPTLLLDRTDYEHIIDQSELTQKSAGNLMLYILDYTDEKRRYIAECVKMLSMQPFETNSKCEIKDASLDEIVQPPVEQWLRSFRDASFVITDSFHACVFSILFHKPFIAIGNKSRGLVRLQNLLSMFGLTDRMATKHPDADICDRKIDWDGVDALLDKLRFDSLSFLDRSLS